jgi:hypothetical protein
MAKEKTIRCSKLESKIESNCKNIIFPAAVSVHGKQV